MSVYFRFILFHFNICIFHDVLMLNYLYHQSCTFSGEFNSNWGKLLRTMRVRLDTPIIQDDGGWNSDTEEKIVGNLKPRFSKTLDVRTAWGPTVPRLPGT